MLIFRTVYLIYNNNRCTFFLVPILRHPNIQFRYLYGTYPLKKWRS